MSARFCDAPARISSPRHITDQAKKGGSNCPPAQTAKQGVREVSWE
jgi:hypothetical protein